MSAAFSQLQVRLAYGLSGATAFGTASWLFRDLADLSQWWLDTDRHGVFKTFEYRHKIAAVSLATAAGNNAIFYRTRCVPLPACVAGNVTWLFLFYSGYINPELMMRPRNHNALYVSAPEALNLLKREETVIVTKISRDDKFRAFPNSQLLRPHVVRIGYTDSNKLGVMTYCGLTNLAMAYELDKHPDGSEVELVPLTQLENNLILMDKKTGHVGQQINAIDETAMLKKLGTKSYHDTSRRPKQCELKELALDGTQMAGELPTWKMNLNNFVRTYPDGEVFINDYKMHPNLKRPVKTIYDKLMDYIFETSVYLQATNPDPVFPTLGEIDKRLPPKEQVWGFNVGDDYVAITENYVRDGHNGTRNFTVGGERIVASYDRKSASLGIWKNPSSKPVTESVDIHGKPGGEGDSLERLPTVKNAAFWCVYATFFPHCKVNPKDS